MSRHTIKVEQRQYSYASNDPPPDGNRTWGVVSVRLVDEITSQSPNGVPFISANYRGLTARVSQDRSVVGLVGIPVNAFPKLMSQAYSVDFTVGADGFLPRKET